MLVLEFRSLCPAWPGTPQLQSTHSLSDQPDPERLTSHNQPKMLEFQRVLTSFLSRPGLERPADPSKNFLKLISERMPGLTIDFATFSDLADTPDRSMQHNRVFDQVSSVPAATIENKATSTRRTGAERMHALISQLNAIDATMQKTRYQGSANTIFSQLDIQTLLIGIRTELHCRGSFDRAQYAA